MADKNTSHLAGEFVTTPKEYRQAENAVRFTFSVILKLVLSIYSRQIYKFKSNGVLV